MPRPLAMYVAAGIATGTVLSYGYKLLLRLWAAAEREEEEERHQRQAQQERRQRRWQAQRERAEEERQQLQVDQEIRQRRWQAKRERAEELAARTCSVCEREFGTLHAKAQHDASQNHKGRVQQLQQEQQRREAKASREQHRLVAEVARQKREQLVRDLQGSRLDPPFPDCQGHWVWLGDLDRHQNSFAFFECTCRRTWLTAHGNSRYRQGCQGCDVQSLPKFMWVNTATHRRRQHDNIDEDDGPHDSDRCEACQRGDCSSQKPNSQKQHSNVKKKKPNI